MSQKAKNDLRHYAGAAGIFILLKGKPEEQIPEGQILSSHSEGGWKNFGPSRCCFPLRYPYRDGQSFQKEL